MERIDCEHCFNSEFYDGDKLRCKLKKCNPKYYEDIFDKEETDRMKLPNDVIEIVEKCGDFDEFSEEDREYIVAQIDELYEGFFEDLSVINVAIVDEPERKHQGYGQYCDQHSVGWTGDSFMGTYYFPTEDDRYLAIEYYC